MPCQARLWTIRLTGNSVIRQEFIAYVAATTDGRVLTGLLAESTGETITLVDAKNQRTVLNRKDVEELKESETSLMPEKLLDELVEQEVRDLVAYIQSENAPAPGEKQVATAGLLEFRLQPAPVDRRGRSLPRRRTAGSSLHHSKPTWPATCRCWSSGFSLRRLTVVDVGLLPGELAFTATHHLEPTRTAISTCAG